MNEGVKRFLFSWVPPAAFTLAKGLPRHNWDGVYESFAAVPGSHGSYDDHALAAETVEATRRVIASPARGPGDGGIMAVIASQLATVRTPVRIVDFGGGAGVDYVLLRAATAAHPFAVDYCVVEHPVTCAAAQSLFRDQPIRFVSTIETATPADLIYSSAALSYVDEWRTTLDSLLALHPGYVILANTLVGDFPTFATAQRNLPGMRVPYWFFSHRELVDFFAEHGFRLVVDVPMGADYDHTNLPANRRPGRARNLVFRYEAVDEARS